MWTCLCSRVLKENSAIWEWRRGPLRVPIHVPQPWILSKTDFCLLLTRFSIILPLREDLDNPRSLPEGWDPRVDLSVARAIVHLSTEEQTPLLFIAIGNGGNGNIVALPLPIVSKKQDKAEQRSVTTHHCLDPTITTIMSTSGGKDAEEAITKILPPQNPILVHQIRPWLDTKPQ